MVVMGWKAMSKCFPSIKKQGLLVKCFCLLPVYYTKGWWFNWLINNFKTLLKKIKINLTHLELYTNERLNTDSFLGKSSVKHTNIQRHKWSHPKGNAMVQSLHAQIALLWFLLCIHREPNLIPFINWIWSF